MFVVDLHTLVTEKSSHEWPLQLRRSAVELQFEKKKKIEMHKLKTIIEVRN